MKHYISDVVKQMKKFVFIFFVALLFVSCNPEGRNYKFKYKIYYPGNTVEKEAYSAETPYLSSHRGTNRLTWVDEKGGYVGEETTAPIEVVSVRKLKINQDDE